MRNWPLVEVASTESCASARASKERVQGAPRASLSYLYQNWNDGTSKQARDSEDESQAKTDECIDAAWVQLDTMYRQWDDRRAVLTSDELFIRRRAVGSLAKEVELCSRRHARSLLVPLLSLDWARLWPWRWPGNGVPEHDFFFLNIWRGQPEPRSVFFTGRTESVSWRTLLGHRGA